MKVHDLGWWLVILGGLNWGLIGLGALMGGTNWNVVEIVFNTMPAAANFLYLLVGGATLWHLWLKLAK